MAPAAATDLRALKRLDEAGEHTQVIAGLRRRLAEDRRAVAKDFVKDWCGRRWRDLFLTEAADDPAAIKAAAKRLAVPGTDLALSVGRDSRPTRQRLAERFLYGEGIDDWSRELPPAKPRKLRRTTIVFCPGLISTLIPVPAFGSEMSALAAERGWRFLRAQAHPMRSCSANVADLAETIEHGRGLDADGEPVPPRRARPLRDVVLIGYSKGTADALTLLVERPDLAPRVRALVTWGGAVGGSYLADNIYEQVKDLALGRAGDALRLAVKAVFPLVDLDRVSDRIEDYDVRGAVKDLTTAERERFLRRNARKLDRLRVPVFQLTAAAGALEVPYFQAQGSLEIERRAGANDMQLALDQARLPSPLATDLATVHAHHWDLSYDPFPRRFRLGAANLDHRFPRRAALAATITLLAELGLIG
jgi:hypothetical protein